MESQMRSPVSIAGHPIHARKIEAP